MFVSSPLVCHFRLAAFMSKSNGVRPNRQSWKNVLGKFFRMREPSLDSRYCGNYGGVYSSRGLGIQTLHSDGEGEVLCAHERTKPESRFSRSSQQWRWVYLARPAYRSLVKGQRAPFSW